MMQGETMRNTCPSRRGLLAVCTSPSGSEYAHMESTSPVIYCAAVNRERVNMHRTQLCGDPAFVCLGPRVPQTGQIHSQSVTVCRCQLPLLSQRRRRTWEQPGRIHFWRDGGAGPVYLCKPRMGVDYNIMYVPCSTPTSLPQRILG